MNKRNLIAALLTALGLGLLLARCRHDKKTDAQINATVLGPNENEKIIVDPGHHSITVVNKSGTQVTSLPGTRPVSITEDKNGKLTVQNRTWGTELSPYFGMGFSDNPRPCLGVGVFYFHRLDVGIAVTSNVKSPLLVRGLLSLNINFFSNTYCVLGIETNHSPYAGLAWRF